MPPNPINQAEEQNFFIDRGYLITLYFQPKFIKNFRGISLLMIL